MASPQEGHTYTFLMMTCYLTSPTPQAKLRLGSPSTYFPKPHLQQAALCQAALDLSKMPTGGLLGFSHLLCNK